MLRPLPVVCGPLVSPHVRGPPCRPRQLAACRAARHPRGPALDVHASYGCLARQLVAPARPARPVAAARPAPLARSIARSSCGTTCAQPRRCRVSMRGWRGQAVAGGRKGRGVRFTVGDGDGGRAVDRVWRGRLERRAVVEQSTA
ncbi:hypothetical protein ZWY2020_021724 [Hordeum vulgare]|nr:hypothetical protein ZWY2020_021724 [Hordeum vulgare]